MNEEYNDELQGAIEEDDDRIRYCWCGVAEPDHDHDGCDHFQVKTYVDYMREADREMHRYTQLIDIACGY